MSKPSDEETQDCIILTDDDTQCQCLSDPELSFDDNITQSLLYSAGNKYDVYIEDDLHVKLGLSEDILQGSYSNVLVCVLKKKPEEILVLKIFLDDNDAKKYNARSIYFCEKLKHDALPEVVGYLLKKDKQHITAILFKHCGVSLLNYILEQDSDDNPLSYYKENRILEWADQLAKVLQYVHDAKILHRDISPYTILIQPDNNLPHGSKLILTDFGSARFMKTGMTRDHGRPGYIAPEEFYESGQTEYCCKVDTYSFGMVWYFAITKTEPFKEVRKTISDKIDLGRFLHKTDWNKNDMATYKNKASIFPGKHPRPLFGECGYTKMQEIVKKCWEHDPKKRPTMNGIQKMISKLRAAEDGQN